jgi:hypothetical protein
VLGVLLLLSSVSTPRSSECSLNCNANTNSLCIDTQSYANQCAPLESFLLLIVALGKKKLAIPNIIWNTVKSLHDIHRDVNSPSDVVRDF